VETKSEDKNNLFLYRYEWI